MDIAKMDDPIWEYILTTKLAPYIPAVRKFWEEVESIDVHSTGVFPLDKESIPDGTPPGLMYRVTNTPVRSPIKNVQVFPFVPTSYLQIINVTGGATRMVSRLCADRNFKLEEFTIIEKSHLPSTYHQGQLVAFVPTAVLEQTELQGKYIYLTHDEMVNLMQDLVTSTVKAKCIKYL